MRKLRNGKITTTATTSTVTASKLFDYFKFENNRNDHYLKDRDSYSEQGDCDQEQDDLSIEYCFWIFSDDIKYKLFIGKIVFYGSYLSTESAITETEFKFRKIYGIFSRKIKNNLSTEYGIFQ